MPTFVHAADLHLDSPLRGLSRYEGAPVARIRNATRRAFVNLVDLCVEREVDLLLLAGDLFDGDWKDYSTGLFFAKQMARLRQAQIDVVMISGNHDAESVLTRNLRLPENVKALPTDEPGTVRFDALGIAVHGQGFATREVREDLTRAYPEPVPGMFNIGLLHTAVSGRPGHEPYAPCTVEGLTSRGYDYWALGHVHTREVLSERPFIVFPGNLQGRHAREQGEKGATFVRLEDGQVRDLKHEVVDVVRFATCDVDVARERTWADVLDAVRAALSEALGAAGGRLLCARVELTGTTHAHGLLHGDEPQLLADVQALAHDLGGDVWIEKLKLRTAPPLSVAEQRGRDDALGQLLTSIAALGEDDAGLSELAAEFRDLDRKLPAALRNGSEGLRVESPDFLRDALQEAEALLLSRLSGESESR